MSSRKTGAALGPLRTLLELGAARELTDGQLLERFLAVRGEAAESAFAALVGRHGPMVLRVCRGVLDDPHDAQDAFQATFLVLVRKARALWVRDSLGPWLHRVAYRTATFARSAAARRRRHERSAAVPPAQTRAGPGDELGRVLHEEIERLPERFRAAVVLCDLEGRTHEQAARHLGWPVGTVKSRLSRGRERLRGRLTRRGVAPGAGLIAAAAGHECPAAPALSLIAGSSSRTLVRGTAASLAQGVIRSMLITRWFKAASVVLALGAAASGVERLAPKGDTDGPPVVEVKPGKLTTVVAGRGVVQAAENLDVYNKIEGQTTILSILPVGTKVKKGQLVATLDTSTLKDRLTKEPFQNKLVNFLPW